MAFGNPYEEPWSIDAVVEACDRIGLLGINQISLADTVGRAHPEQISEVVAAVRAAIPDVEFGVHLHAPPDEAPKRIRAAFNAGCMRFDSAVGGLGGCPLAQDSLVGNIPTEVLLAELARCGATLPRLGSLEPLIRKAEDFAVRATFGQNRSELRDVQADWRIS